MFAAIAFAAAIVGIASDDFATRERAEHNLTQYASDNVRQFLRVRTVTMTHESPEVRDRARRVLNRAVHAVVNDACLPGSLPWWPDIDYLGLAMADEEGIDGATARWEFSQKLRYRWLTPDPVLASSGVTSLYLDYRRATRRWAASHLIATGDPATIREYVARAAAIESVTTRDVHASYLIWTGNWIEWESGNLNYDPSLLKFVFRACPEVMNRRYWSGDANREAYNLLRR